MICQRDMGIEITIAANGITAVAQTPTTIALIANGLKAAPVTVAMRTNKKDMDGKVDGAANRAAVVMVAVVRVVAVNTVAAKGHIGGGQYGGGSQWRSGGEYRGREGYRPGSENDWDYTDDHESRYGSFVRGYDTGSYDDTSRTSSRYNYPTASARVKHTVNAIVAMTTTTDVVARNVAG